MSTIHPSSSIPELIKFIRYSLRESEFDEFQKTLMDREKMMQMKVENLAKECASLKKRIDFLEKLQSFTVLEKCSAEEKLGRSERRLDEERVEMGETVRMLRCEKLGVEEKLERSERKCGEMGERLAKMRKVMEELRRDAYEVVVKFRNQSMDDELRGKKEVGEGVVVISDSDDERERGDERKCRVEEGGSLRKRKLQSQEREEKTSEAKQSNVGLILELVSGIAEENPPTARPNRLRKRPEKLKEFVVD